MMLLPRESRVWLLLSLHNGMVDVMHINFEKMLSKLYEALPSKYFF